MRLLLALAIALALLTAVAGCRGREWRDFLRHNRPASTQPSTQPAARASVVDQVAEGAEQLGRGLNGAAAAVAPINPPLAAALSTAGGLATFVSLALKRKLTWGVWRDRRRPRRQAWAEDQRRARIQTTTAEASPAAERIPPRIDAGGPGPIAAAESPRLAA